MSDQKEKKQHQVRAEKSVKTQIKIVKASLKTAKSNLDELKIAEEPNDKNIKKQEATVLRFETRLNNLNARAKEERPGFFKRTSTWVIFGGVTAVALGTAWFLTRGGSDDSGSDEETSDGNGDTI